MFRSRYATPALLAILMSPMLVFAIAVTLELNGRVATNSDTALPDGTFEDGWQWTIPLTVPMSETGLSLKFSDITNGDTTIPAGGNIRVYSEDSDHGPDNPIDIAEADTWSDPLILDGDIGEESGRQVEVVVQVRIPEGTTGSGYSFTYDVQSSDIVPPVITMNGDAEVDLTICEAYADAGASATDAHDGDLTSEIVTSGVAEVNTTVPGTYHVTYDVTDSAGNAAVQRTRTVVVADAECGPPIPPDPGGSL